MRHKLFSVASLLQIAHTAARSLPIGSSSRSSSSSAASDSPSDDSDDSTGSGSGDEGDVLLCLETNDDDDDDGEGAHSRQWEEVNGWEEAGDLSFDDDDDDDGVKEHHTAIHQRARRNALPHARSNSYPEDEDELDSSSSANSDQEDDRDPTDTDDDDDTTMPHAFVTPGFSAVVSDVPRSIHSSGGFGGYRHMGTLIPPDTVSQSEMPHLTVVLDLDETLGSFRTEPALYRPHLKAFFETLQSFDCEVVVWTAALREYAGQRLAFDGCYMHHLIGRDARWYNGQYPELATKNLKLLGRDLRRCVIVENSPLSVRLNPGNAILVQNYTAENVRAQLEAGGQDDSFLVVKEVIEYMANAVKEDPENVSVPELLRSCPLLRRAHFADGTICCHALKYEAPGVPLEFGTP